MDPFEQQLLSDLRDRQDRLEEEFHSSRKRTEEMLQQLVAVTQQNQTQMSVLIEETRDLVSFYKDVQSMGRMGKRIQTAMIWVSKWPLIGTGLYFLGHSFLEWARAKGLV